MTPVVLEMMFAEFKSAKRKEPKVQLLPLVSHSAHWSMVRIKLRDSLCQIALELDKDHQTKLV